VHVDPMAFTSELKVEAMMNKADTLHALADTSCVQQIDGALFENASAHPLLDIRPVAVFENNRRYPLMVQEMGEHQASRASTSDGNLCMHRGS